MTKKEVAAVLFSLANGIAQTAEDLAKEAGEKSQIKEKDPEKKEANPPESDKPSKAPEEKKKEIHLEDVRAVLSEISRSGHTAEMKALLAKHGAKKLSDVPSEDYEQLLAEAEEVKNA